MKLGAIRLVNLSFIGACFIAYFNQLKAMVIKNKLLIKLLIKKSVQNYTFLPYEMLYLSKTLIKSQYVH